MRRIPSERERFCWRVIKLLWIFACVSTLVLTLLYRGPKYRDAVLEELIIMSSLSFPTGFVVATSYLDAVKHATELQEIFLVWIPLFVIGYLQWFVLVPFVARRIRRRFGNDGPVDLSITR